MAIFGLKARPLAHTTYYSFPENAAIGDYALVDTEQGPFMGRVISGPLRSLPGSGEENLPKIIRMATEEDLEIIQKNEALAKQAASYCKRCVKRRKLDMKVVDVEVFFDRSKLVFYFTAPGRVDFRELVKDLVSEYRARIELRQIGVRNETQMVGALGNCGMVCCCRGHLRKFSPVTIKMAKEQNLFLNPVMISGICGRLLCCLAYEQDNYEHFHRESPRPGKKYSTSRGVAKVLRVNMFTNSVAALMENNEEVEFSLEEWRALNPARGAHDRHSGPENARDRTGSGRDAKETGQEQQDDMETEPDQGMEF